MSRACQPHQPRQASTPIRDPAMKPRTTSSSRRTASLLRRCSTKSRPASSCSRSSAQGRTVKHVTSILCFVLHSVPVDHDEERGHRHGSQHERVHDHHAARALPRRAADVPKQRPGHTTPICYCEPATTTSPTRSPHRHADPPHLSLASGHHYSLDNPEPPFTAGSCSDARTTASTTRIGATLHCDSSIQPRHHFKYVRVLAKPVELIGERLKEESTSTQEEVPLIDYVDKMTTRTTTTSTSQIYLLLSDKWKCED